MSRIRRMLQRIHPTILMTVTLVVTCAALVWLGGSSLYAYHRSEAALARSSTLARLRGDILRFDEVLTMSARMAAATGDPQWERRYRQTEPELDAAIKETIRLTGGPVSDASASKTDQANIRLVAMENRGFRLVSEGESPEALALLSSPEYHRQKAIYAEGMAEFAAGLSGRVQRMRQALDGGGCDDLVDLARQFADAADRCGRPALAEAAETLEAAARHADVEAAGPMLKVLADLCQTVIHGRCTPAVEERNAT